MVEKLSHGHLHGRVIKTLKVADFVLSEIAYDACCKLPPHAHESSYFCFVQQGAYTERFGQREVVCSPSSLTFRPSDLAHEDRVHDTTAQIFVIEISPRWIEKLRTDSLILTSAPEFCGGAMPRLVARLNREFHRPDTAAKLAIEGIALELLAEAVRRPGAEIRNVPAWLRQAREMILEHFPESLTLTQIAAEVDVHPVYLATAFRQRFGMSIGEFVRHLRIEHACAELLKSDASLADIALRAGFADQSHF